jgi:hypothetical protein
MRNHHLSFLEQLMRFSASWPLNAQGGRLSAFWRCGPTDQGTAKHGNAGARQHSSEHLAAIHIHVAAPSQSPGHGPIADGLEWPALLA